MNQATNEEKEHVALVTGGTRGIGAAIAKALATRGVRVVINGRHSDDQVNGVMTDLKILSDAELIVGDAAERAVAQRMVSEALDRFGRVDYVVPAAGGGHPGHILDLSDEEWLEAFR